MGRKPLPEGEKKEKITINLPGWMIEKLREMDNYNEFIFKILLKFIKR